jgi:uncharacterized protein DUF4389
VPDYPARLEIEYPEHHRRGLPLIGWWLLGIPQYAIASLLAGGGSPAHVDVLTLLVIVAGVLLLFGRGYPRDVFAFIMGLNRYVFRVFAFATFLTPVYPPFRLDDEVTTAPAPGVPQSA